jgi:hypothetical protein
MVRPGNQGPETSSEAFDLDRAFDLLMSNGALAIRRYLTARQVGELLAAAARIYSEREARWMTQEPAGKEARQRLRGTISHEQLRGADEAAAKIPRQSSYQRLAERYLESRELVPNHITALRRVGGDQSSSYLPFHQDEPIVGRPLLNIWIALDDCGIRRPGIEVVLTPRTDILPPSPEASEFAANRVALDEALVFRTYGESAVWAPAFEAGDALIFKGTTIHRTHFRPGMSGTRTSAEMRLTRDPAGKT